jgi:hypothetical protein
LDRLVLHVSDLSKAADAPRPTGHSVNSLRL